MIKKLRHFTSRFLCSQWSSVCALVANLLLVLIVYNLCRIIYMMENYDQLLRGQSLSSIVSIFQGGLKFDFSAMVYTNSLYIVLTLLPVWHRASRRYQSVVKFVFVAVNALSVVINLCDAVYFPYTSRRTTTSVFSEFSNESNLMGIFFHEIISHWYLVLAAIVLTYLLHRLYVRPQYDSRSLSTTAKKVRYVAVHTIILALSIPLFVGACRGGLGVGIRPITINNANQYTERPIDCASVLNTPFSLLRTIGKSVFKVPTYYSNISEAKRYSPITKTTSSDSINTTVRSKNVVILIVESLGREYIGSLNRSLSGGNYAGYTPHLDSLISKSCVFRYSFSNGRKSIDGMPSILCGIPMFVEPFVLTPSSMNDYTSIAGVLGHEGYQTAFFHGAPRGSMGFQAFANKVGFADYYGLEDYVADSRFGGKSDFDGNWGISDEPFLQFYCQKMNEMREPFMTAVFTLSSHHPFELPEAYSSVYREEELPIHKCIRYTDMAIGKFFAAASRQSWYKNTIFVITADHTNQTAHPYYQSDIGLFSVPIIVFDPSGEISAGERDIIAQQIDITPTLLGYLGVKKPFFCYGIDLFATKSSDAYAVNYTNGVYQYVKGNYILQFDGEKTKAVYSISDSLMRQDVYNSMPIVQRESMENELKALIYEYMYRMVNDKMR